MQLEKRRLLSDQPHRAERLVTAILRVFVPNDAERRAFSITYAYVYLHTTLILLYNLAFPDIVACYCLLLLVATVVRGEADER